MLTSSPTVSAPPSPSAAFHPPSRPYHASRRTSVSSSVHSLSPRFAVSCAQSRRHDASSTSRPTPIPSPSNKRRYTDTGTQYTPPGFPPTYHPPTQATDANTANTDKAIETNKPQAVQLAAPVIPDAPRGLPPAAPTVTDPPEPALRIDPQPVVPARHVQSQSQGTARAAEGEGTSQEQSALVRGPSSPAKRARPQDPNVKVMPLQYETCDVRNLGVLISDMLMELVRINDEQPLRDGQLTRFHSRAPPGISVRDYLSRLIIHATLSPPILLSMVFYVDKLCAMYPAFTISSLTVHRFLITAATVAAKGLSDSFWTNSLYARVGGVSVRELALLELEFLRRLDWRIVPKPEVLVDYYKGLVERGNGFVIEKEPAVAAPTPNSNQTLTPTGSATGIQTT